MRDSLDLLKTHEAQMLDDLRLFAEQDTPSTGKALPDTFAGFLTTYADERTGGSTEILPVEGSGDHVRWGDKGREAPILLLGHYDTAWPTGTLREMPFEARDGLATEPGIFGMECALKLHDQSDPLRTGTTVNVGVASGGTRYSVIAAEAAGEADVRVVTQVEAERAIPLLSALEPHNSETRATVQGWSGRRWSGPKGRGALFQSSLPGRGGRLRTREGVGGSGRSGAGPTQRTST